MEEIIKEVSKYVLSLFLFIIGIAFLTMYLDNGASGLEQQPPEMLVAALFILFAGVLSLPQIYTRMSKIIKAVLMLLVFCCSGYLGYAVYNSIDSEIKVLEQEKEYNGELIQRFIDLRDAEVAYRKVYGKYTADVQGELISFVNAKAIPLPLNWGVFHDSVSQSWYEENGFILRTSDLDSIARSIGVSEDKLRADIDNNLTTYKVRDTLYVSYWDEYFAPAKRADKELPMVDLSKLNLNPRGDKLIINVSSIESGGTRVPTIEAKDPKPFDRNPKDELAPDTLKFGGLESNHTDGNWINAE